MARLSKSEEVFQKVKAQLQQQKALLFDSVMGGNAGGETAFMMTTKAVQEAYEKLLTDYIDYLEEQNMSEQQFVSINPANAVAGGGKFDDIDVRVKECRTAFFDYQGKVATPVPALKVVYERLDDEGGEFEQHYSAGKPENFVPSQDGRHFVPVSEEAKVLGLGASTNALLWITNLILHGFPANKVSQDVSVFEGVEFHAGQIPGKGQNKQPVLVCVKPILKLPGENNGNAQAAKPTGKAAKAQATVAAASPVASSAPSSTATTSPELLAKATEGLVALLAAKGGSITRAAVAQEAFKHFAKDPDRNALVKLVYEENFLKTEGQPWTYDGTTISLG